MFLLAAPAVPGKPEAAALSGDLSRPLGPSPRLGVPRRNDATRTLAHWLAAPAGAASTVVAPTLARPLSEPEALRPSLPRSQRVPGGAYAVVNDADLPRAIAIPSRVMAMAGDTCAGLLLSQLIYWTRRGSQTTVNDGWVFKTAAEWQQETGMSWKVQHRARALLLERDLIEERRLSMPSRLEFRLKLGALARELAPRTDVEINDLSLGSFLELDGEVVDRLLGRAFLFHSILTRIWPVPTAMLCSRLVAGVRVSLFALSGAAEANAGAWSGTTRLIRLHRDTWRAETGLSRDQWQTARRNLAGSGVLVERRHNFPRRVDLAIDLAALAATLRAGRRLITSQAAQAEAGWDRAKQVGGIGQRPIPPTESPDPADSDRPILPISAAQSRLYPVLDELRQPPRHPARVGEGPQAGAMQFGSWGGGWGEKGYASQKTAFREKLPAGETPKPASAAAADTPGDDASAAPQVTQVALAALVWPSIFGDEDRAQAGRHLAGLDRAIQQQLLDEIDWQHSSGKPIRSPVALTRALARKAVQGLFSPDGAHRVAAGRQRDAAEAARRATQAAERAARAQSQTEGQSPKSTQSPEVRARLDAVKADIARRAAGKRSA